MRALSRPTLRRTCRNCGYTWKVSKFYAKPHPSGFAVVGGGPSTTEQLSTSNESMAEAVSQLSLCAQCQSKH